MTATMAVSVREMRAGERGEVRDLLTSAYREYAEVLPPDVYQIYLADLLHPGTGTTLVVRAGTRLVGTARLYLDPSAEGVGLPAEWAWVRAVGVRPDARGAGIGWLVMTECATRAAAGGARVLSLHTAAFMPAAIRLYERMGYRQAPEYDIDATAHYGVPVDDPVIALAYRLDLTPDCVR